MFRCLNTCSVDFRPNKSQRWPSRMDVAGFPTMARQSRKREPYLNRTIGKHASGELCVGPPLAASPRYRRESHNLPSLPYIAGHYLSSRFHPWAAAMAQPDGRSRLPYHDAAVAQARALQTTTRQSQTCPPRPRRRWRRAPYVNSTQKRIDESF